MTDRILQSDQERVSETQSTAKQARQVSRLMLLIAMAAGLSVIAQVVVFAYVREWQLLGSTLLGLIGGVLFLWAYWQARKGRLRLVAYWVVGGVLVLFPAFALLWKNAGWVFALGALIMPAPLAGLFWPRKYVFRVWFLGLVACAVTLGLDALLETVSLWKRFDVTQNVFLQWFVAGIVGIVILLVLVELVGLYQRINNIQARLVTAFVVLVVVVAVAVTAASVWTAWNSSREQMFRQLDSVTELKKNEIVIWVDNLKFELDTVLVEQYELSRIEILLSQSLTEVFRQEAAQGLRAKFQNLMDRTQRFEELLVLDLEGRVALSSNPNREGRSQRQEPYFQRGLEEHYVRPPTYYPALGKMAVVVSRPIVNLEGDVVGVLVGVAGMDRLNEIMAEASGLGETGRTYLVSQGRTMLTKAPGDDENVYSAAIERAIENQGAGLGAYPNYNEVQVLGAYTWIPEIEVVLLSEVAQSQVQEGVLTTVVVNTGVAVGILVLAISGSVWFARSISNPLNNLANVATQIAGGQFDLAVQIRREDEIGALAQAFNGMTVQLRDLIANLEERVAERTRGLSAVAEVTRATTSILDPAQLLPQIVELVRERFDLYYVGLFLVEEQELGEPLAVLRAGSGEAGHEMLAQGWNLPVGGDSMIGQCVATGEIITKQREGDAAVRFDNPLLPQTRSELALPLRYGQQIIGAMTVQSTADAAFDDTAITILQNMADQVAVAVENARLFAEAQAALDRAQMVQQRYQGQAWDQYVRSRRVSGYEKEGPVIKPLAQDLLPEVGQLAEHADLAARQGPTWHGNTLLVPIVQSNRVIGSLGIEQTQGQDGWSPDQVALVESIVVQLFQAAETQRLFEEAQRRATREQMIGEITARVGQNLDLDIVLQTAVQEIAERMGLRDVVIQLAVAEE